MPQCATDWHHILKRPSLWRLAKGSLTPFFSFKFCKWNSGLWEKRRTKVTICMLSYNKLKFSRLALKINASRHYNIWTTSQATDCPIYCLGPVPDSGVGFAGCSPLGSIPSGAKRGPGRGGLCQSDYIGIMIAPAGQGPSVTIVNGLYNNRSPLLPTITVAPKAYNNRSWGGGGNYNNRNPGFNTITAAHGCLL